MPSTKQKGGTLPPLNAVLEELASRRETLDKLDSEISSLIKRIEEGLSAHFSVRVSAEIADSGDTDAYEHLVFGKHDGKWQLAIETGVIAEPEYHRVTPLLSSPRETRMRMFVNGHVEQLIRGAVEQLDRQIANRRKAIEVGSSLAEALDGIPF